MTVVADLIRKPGVIAAGEYTYKQELSYFEGDLSAEQAQMLAIMCYSATKGVVMEGDMLASFNPQGGIQPPRGWIMRGPERTLCVMANVFCLIDNQAGSLNQIFGFMRQAIAHETLKLV